MSTTPEAYVHLSADQTTLTFYYDSLRADRDGTTRGIRDTKKRFFWTIPAWTDWDYPNTTVLTAVFDASFRDFLPTTTAKWFYCLKSLKNIEGFEHLNTSQVTDMEQMFRGCSSLTTLDLSCFDTSRVTGMSLMFYGCSSLTALDLSSFDTSQVTDMSLMFDGCSSLTALDLTSFDTSEVTDMVHMFDGCSSLTTLDLSSFDTSQVTDMGRMFDGCSSLIALDLSSFDTSQVTCMREMFASCSALTTILSFAFRNCLASEDMFYECSSLQGARNFKEKYTDARMANPERGYFTKKVLSQEDEAYVHLSADKKILTFYFDRERNVRMRCYAWGIETTIRQNDQRTPEWLSSEVTSEEEITQIIIDESFRNVVPKTTASWFEGLSAVTKIRGLDNLNTSEVTDMSCMFAGCSALRTLDVSRFDTSQVTDMSGMFRGCSSLTTLGLSSFRTSKVTDMSRMFLGCESLTALDLTSFDTSQVTDMRGMFYGCSSLTVLDLSSFDTSKVTDMSRMFNDCESLTTLDLTSFDTSEVTDMRKMFSGCSSLISLDLSSFDTSQVMYMGYMFRRCSSLTTLDLSSFNTSQVTDMREMFRRCSSLPTIYSNSSWSCRYSNDMFSGCNSLRGTATNVGKSFDVSMANPGRGYFTRKVLSQEVEAYVHLSANQTTLTFYYDSLRADRDGTTWGIRDTKEGFFWTIPAWTGDWGSPNTSVLTAVFDASFRDFLPTTTAKWFYYLKSLKSIEGFEYLNTSQVTAMEDMFYGCSSLTSLDLTRFDTSDVTGMSWMFSGCESLTSLALTRFDTSDVTSMSHMFSGCSSLTALDLSSFDTSQVASMSNMFRGCSSLTSLDLSRFDTSQVTDMEEMFASCSSLISLDLSSFDTSQVTDMHAMFKNCKSLTTLDLSNFQTSEVKNMGEMFSGCSTLTTILSFAFRNCFASEAMFYECSSLQGAANFNEKYTDARMANPERGYFTKKEL